MGHTVDFVQAPQNDGSQTSLGLNTILMYSLGFYRPIECSSKNGPKPTSKSKLTWLPKWIHL